MKYLIILLLLLSITPILNAQNIPTPAIMTMINAELTKRGLNESEVKSRLLKEGIDLENIPPAELPKYQTKVMAVLDEMEKEKKAAASDTTKVVPSAITINIPKTPMTTKEEAIAEAEQRVIQKAASLDNPDAIYGHGLFTDQSLDVFRTTDGSRAPDTYILGAGDEIRITIFGASQTDMQLPINIDGYIQPSGMPKIFLQGLTMLQAKSLLHDRLSASYTFNPDQFAITVASARTIMVNVFGETKLTGGFNLSALNSAFNALSAAGGPTNIGTVRAIQLIRGNARKTIDLYAFMNDPAIQFKFDLQQNDILYVPVAQQLVKIEGAVKRPMQYEMLPNETLADLIKYAGGIKMNAYPDFVQIERVGNGEVRLQEWNLTDVISGKQNVSLRNGDIVRIREIGKPIEQFTEISGSVFYPGRYDLAGSPSLDLLLKNAQPTPQAKMDLVFVERMRPDSTIEQLNLNWQEMSHGGQTFKLQPRDKINIPQLARYRDVDSITVSGYVRKPFTKNYRVGDHLTIKQAIEMAGGLQTSAFPVAYIFRKDVLNPQKMQYIRIELDKAANLQLQPGDQLNVYDNTTYVNVGEVRVSGAVKNPRAYTYDSSLTIRDLITTSGGFTVGAALNRIEIFRTVLSPKEAVKLEMITLEVDSAFHVLSPAGFDIHPYDQVVVRQTPAFSMGRMVEISGEVVYPGVYLLGTKSTPLSTVIKKAGGLLTSADAKGSRLFRTFNSRGLITMDVDAAMRNAGNLKLDPILFEGDVININRLENTVSIASLGTRLKQTNLDSSLTTRSLNIVYQGNHSAKWYVKNYAGGFIKEADKKSVTITLKNGQMKSTKSFLWLFKKYPQVETGATVSMQLKPPKVPKTGDEKMNWDSFWSRTLAATTAIVTLLVLSKQL